MTHTITGLIGDPVSHSLSPRIHSYWANQYNLPVDYKLFTTKAPRLRQTMLHMRKKQVAGINITLPHKQAVMEYLDGLDEIATRIGAVNTVVNRDGKFMGTNTDAYGFITNLKEQLGDLTPYLTRVVILGGGGAARAAIMALKEAGAKQIVLCNRTWKTAMEMAHQYGVEHALWEQRDEALSGTTLLVNTTSLGMTGKSKLVLNLNNLTPEAAVHDIVYSPLDTYLLQDARQREHKVVDGLGMLLYQAQKAFELWHGILPEVTDALRAYVLASDEV